MAVPNQTPIYNLNVVLKLTGLKADALRAWERRYSLPQPNRSAGGHRLYSDYDIETIKWLQARQSDGLSISRAVELWKEILNAGRDPLAEVSNGRGAELDSVLVPAPRVDILRLNWQEACLHFDGVKAEEIINHAFDMFPIDVVCMDILQKGLSNLGLMWYQGEASMQQEHFASAIASRRLESLITATPYPTRSQTLLLGCPPDEWHTFPLLLLNLQLRRFGYRVVYLGANTPIEQFLDTAVIIKPNLVILAAQQLTTAVTLKRVAKLLYSQRIPLAFGGLIFNRIPNLYKKIPAFFLGECLEGVVPIIENIISGDSIFPTFVDEVSSYLPLEESFRKNRPLIENEVVDIMKKENLRKELVEDVNEYFGVRLSAALDLGDLYLLNADFDWVQGLLSRRQIDKAHLISYFKAYSYALRKIMGSMSMPITKWITSYQINFADAQ
ncbi:MAG: hypothetical protein CVU46_17480 [Chloroflexi bacterium HGW-Chloroflexi-8]|nr:MAG: hypothetical protein CVU46_17480 [Chloroflexi bacterium HGW-Chloroflexi-8]